MIRYHWTVAPQGGEIDRHGELTVDNDSESAENQATNAFHALMHVTPPRSHHARAWLYGTKKGRTNRLLEFTPENRGFGPAWKRDIGSYATEVILCKESGVIPETSEKSDMAPKKGLRKA